MQREVETHVPKSRLMDMGLQGPLRLSQLPLRVSGVVGTFPLVISSSGRQAVLCRVRMSHRRLGEGHSCLLHSRCGDHGVLARARHKNFYKKDFTLNFKERKTSIYCLLPCPEWNLQPPAAPSECTGPVRTPFQPHFQQ